MMTRILVLILLLSLFFKVDAQTEYRDFEGLKWTVKSDNLHTSEYLPDELILEDDSLSFDFSPNFTSYRQEIRVHIYNKTGQKVRVKWNEAVLYGSRVLFADMRRFEINQPLQDGIIYSQQGIYKTLTNEFIANNPYVRIVDFDGLKKTYKKTKTIQSKDFTLIIPILYSDNKEVDYKFNFIATYDGTKK